MLKELYKLRSSVQVGTRHSLEKKLCMDFEFNVPLQTCLVNIHKNQLTQSFCLH